MTDKKVIAGILLVGPEPPIARRMFNSSDLIFYFEIAICFKFSSILI